MKRLPKRTFIRGKSGKILTTDGKGGREEEGEAAEEGEGGRQAASPVILFLFIRNLLVLKLVM